MRQGGDDRAVLTKEIEADEADRCRHAEALQDALAKDGAMARVPVGTNHRIQRQPADVVAAAEVAEEGPEAVEVAGAAVGEAGMGEGAGAGQQDAADLEPDLSQGRAGLAPGDHLAAPRAGAIGAGPVGGVPEADQVQGVKIGGDEGLPDGRGNGLGRPTAEAWLATGAMAEQPTGKVDQDRIALRAAGIHREDRV